MKYKLMNLTKIVLVFSMLIRINTCNNVYPSNASERSRQDCFCDKAPVCEEIYSTTRNMKSLTYAANLIVNDIIKNDDIQKFKILLQGGLNPLAIIQSGVRKEDVSLDSYAISTSAVKIIEEIYKVTNKKSTWSDIEKNRKNINIVNVLLKYLNLQENLNGLGILGEAPIHKAVWDNEEYLVNILLGRSDVDINKRDFYGFTPIYIACRTGNQRIVESILKKRADVNVNLCDKYGISPIHIAVCYNKLNIVRLLLEKTNADINSFDESGFSVLISACGNGNEEIVKLLLDQVGININARNRYGSTALSLASKKGYTSIVKMLMG